MVEVEGELERRRARDLALGRWMAGAMATSLVAGLVGVWLPWRLSDELRCVAAFEATVGPLSLIDEGRDRRPSSSGRTPGAARSRWFAST